MAGSSDIESVMDRMVHAQVTTTQKNLHTFTDADHKDLSALNHIRHHQRPQQPPQQPTT